MADPTLPTGGASPLVRRMLMRVNVGTKTAPEWVIPAGRQEIKLALTEGTADTSNMDSVWKATAKTSLTWAIEAKYGRLTNAARTAYDEGQEFLRSKGVGKVGVDAEVEVQFFEVWDGPRVEAYQGTGFVKWSPDGGNMEAADTVSVSIQGSGPLEEIEHPFPNAA